MANKPESGGRVQELQIELLAADKRLRESQHELQSTKAELEAELTNCSMTLDRLRVSESINAGLDREEIARRKSELKKVPDLNSRLRSQLMDDGDTTDLEDDKNDNGP